MLLYESNPPLGKSTFGKSGAKTENQGSPYLSYNGLAPPFQRWMLIVYAGSQGLRASRESRTNNIPRSP